MAYIKPQSPLTHGENFIYPITTHDQIVLPDGSRWDGVSNKISSVNGKVGAVELDATDIGAATMIRCNTWAEYNGWSSTAPYTQTVSTPGVLASDTPLVDIYFLDSDTTATSLARLESWNCVNRIVAGNDTLTLYAYEEKPSEGFGINVMVVR